MTIKIRRWSYEVSEGVLGRTRYERPHQAFFDLRGIDVKVALVVAPR